MWAGGLAVFEPESCAEGLASAVWRPTRATVASKKMLPLGRRLAGSARTRAARSLERPHLFIHPSIHPDCLLASCASSSLASWPHLLPNSQLASNSLVSFRFQAICCPGGVATRSSNGAD